MKSAVFIAQFTECPVWRERGVPSAGSRWKWPERPSQSYLFLISPGRTARPLPWPSRLRSPRIIRQL